MFMRCILIPDNSSGTKKHFFLVGKLMSLGSPALVLRDGLDTTYPIPTMYLYNNILYEKVRSSVINAVRVYSPPLWYVHC